MKKNIVHINTKNFPDKGVEWWKWEEFCDDCGEKIFGYERKSSIKPNMHEHDLCVKCLEKRLKERRAQQVEASNGQSPDKAERRKVDGKA